MSAGVTYTIKPDPTSFYYPYYVADKDGRWMFVAKRGSGPGGGFEANEQCRQWIKEHTS